MICWVIAILLYLLVAWFTYEKFVKEWSQPTWEKIMLSLSWVCILPLYGIRKIQELLFFKKK